ncbi:hypothetical protein Tco_0371482 [Tanacetum coccineum]
MEEMVHVTFSEDDEAISQSSTEGDAINFNENRSFPDDEFLEPRSKVTQCPGNIEYFPYKLAYENTTPTDSPFLQDSDSPEDPPEFNSKNFKNGHQRIPYDVQKPIPILSPSGPNGSGKNKMNENEVVIKNKARLVAQDYNSRKGLIMRNFAHVVSSKPSRISSLLMQPTWRFICGETFNWQTSTYGKMEYCEDEDDCFTNFETKFPTIVLDNTLTSDAAISCGPTVTPLSDNEIDFRISFDESDDEDYTVVYHENSFSYIIISVNNLKTDSENDNHKVNRPSFPSPELKVSYFNDLDFFKYIENEFPAIVYNDALTSKSDFSTEPILNPQHIDEF